MTNLESLARKYFETFNSQNIDELSRMFSEDIILRDWNVEEKGKLKVLQINKNIFSEVPSINVNVLKLYQNENSIAADLLIKLDKNDHIYVVDIIDFNSKNLITSIRAYKG